VPLGASGFAILTLYSKRACGYAELALDRGDADRTAAARRGVAFPLSRKSEIIFGNIAGTAVIFAAAFALILREAVELERLTRSCLDAGFVCSPQPSAFARHAIYACISLIEVVASRPGISC
jgi:hypothetical protein